MRTIITRCKSHVAEIDSDKVFEWLRKNIVPLPKWPPSTSGGISRKVEDHVILASAIARGYSLRNIIEEPTTTNNQNNQDND